MWIITVNEIAVGWYEYRASRGNEYRTGQVQAWSAEEAQRVVARMLK